MNINHPQFIIIHHTATPLDNNPRTFDAVKRYHISKGWGDIGYHWFIERDGTLFKGREENVVGCHCSQESMNFKSIGICLEGNFDVEEPTKEQIETLKEIVFNKIKEYHIEIKNILPHRHFAKYKSCPGKKFTDDMIKNITSENSNIDFISQWIGKCVVNVVNGEVFIVNKEGNLVSMNEFPLAIREKFLKLGIVTGMSQENIEKFNKEII